MIYNKVLRLFNISYNKDNIFNIENIIIKKNNILVYIKRLIFN